MLHRTYTKEIGQIIVKSWKNKKKGIKERLTRDYASAVSDLAWGGSNNDIVYKTIF